MKLCSKCLKGFSCPIDSVFAPFVCNTCEDIPVARYRIPKVKQRETKVIELPIVTRPKQVLKPIPEEIWVSDFPDVAAQEALREEVRKQLHEKWVSEGMNEMEINERDYEILRLQRKIKFDEEQRIKEDLIVGRNRKRKAFEASAEIEKLKNELALERKKNQRCKEDVETSEEDPKIAAYAYNSATYEAQPSTSKTEKLLVDKVDFQSPCRTLYTAKDFQMPSEFVGHVPESLSAAEKEMWKKNKERHRSNIKQRNRRLNQHLAKCKKHLA